MTEQTCNDLKGDLVANSDALKSAYLDMQTTSTLAAAAAFDLLLSETTRIMGELTICARTEGDTDTLSAIRAVTRTLDQMDEYSDRTLALYESNRRSMAQRYQRYLGIYVDRWATEVQHFFA